MNLPMTIVLAATLAAASVQRYESVESKRLVPMLTEVIGFATYEGNAEAHAAQKAWLMKTAADLGFVARDAGKVTEIELAADVPDAPVLGLVIHGDVVPAEPEKWSFPPFGAGVENGYVLGRGAADDKGPLVQALLAMKVLKESGAKRTHTIRLLVGSEEESSAGEMKEYLETHAAPDYSLVLDSEFPVVVGEKAWDALVVTTKLTSVEAAVPGRLRTTAAEDGRLHTNPFVVTSLDAGLSPSIVPDRAELTLTWTDGAPRWAPVIRKIGKSVQTKIDGNTLRVTAYGKAAHSGVNLSGGRNAIVMLAKAVESVLPRGGARDLLAFAKLAGQDLHGTGLGITDRDPVWGRYGVNVAMLKPDEKDATLTALTINLRRIPPRKAKELQAHLANVVAGFNARTGAALAMGEGYFEDEPFGHRTDAALVRRLMSIYEEATGEKAKPAISGGGTYAKRLPNAIAFGMWFPGKPYPGHDVDEKISIADLHRGARVLIHALADIATGPRIEKPF